MKNLTNKNHEITHRVLQACVDVGVREFVVCAGSRNSSFVEALRLEENLRVYYWPEERSAAFFAIGKARATKKPVAVITTSGTAAAELFPAVMEAHYSGDPLILITADRPRYFRGSGAPQSAEQKRMFGHYTKIALDIAHDDFCDLRAWDFSEALHINVCLDEPLKGQHAKILKLELDRLNLRMNTPSDFNELKLHLDKFISSVKHPLAIVSTLNQEDKECVAEFLLALNIPVMLEGISGLREDVRLNHLKITRTDKILEDAKENGYEIDGILRIGGIPTHRIWRDLEDCEDEINVLGISRLAFSGLSWSRHVVQCQICEVLPQYQPFKKFESEAPSRLLSSQKAHSEKLKNLILNESKAEPSLIYSLSKLIGDQSSIYLGNSLPIREWDFSAAREQKNWMMRASRGVNGIDGQISTFLGSCQEDRHNWGIFGDLTALYDLVGCWILPKIEAKSINIVIINNGGGKIFDRMYPYKEMQNLHDLNFKPLAELWRLEYHLWTSVPEDFGSHGKRLIEIVPDEAATSRFWNHYEKINLYDDALV